MPLHDAAGPPRAVIVTGSHRSGTTWVGECLGRSPSATYIFEPFNRELRPTALRHRIERAFPYVHAGNEDRYPHLRADVDAMLRLRYPFGRALVRGPFPRGGRYAVHSAIAAAQGRIRHRRALLKDPIALLASGWIADTFGADIVVTARHPAAFAVSLQDKAWSFDFGQFTGQPDLLDGPFAAFGPELLAAVARPLPIVAQGALLWKCLYSYVRDELAPRTDCTVVRHEDIAADPRRSYLELFRACALERPADFDARFPEQPPGTTDVSRFTDRWREQLADDDRDTVRGIVGDSADWLYGADTWRV